MNINKILSKAGVPYELHREAIKCFEESKKDQPSHIYKHYVRLTKAKKIAKLLDWEDNRLIYRFPELKKYDIAPMLNTTCNGDNPPWLMTSKGARPYEECSLDKDQESQDYKDAVERCYWAPGHHPRSYEARVAWYARNACEYDAYVLGKFINLSEELKVWQKNNIVVLNCGDVWQAYGTLDIIGPLKWKFDVGYEIGNVFAFIDGKWVQSWYPIDGYLLKAPVCFVVYPTLF